jgi:A/G-specific adenine glycosylase
MRASGKRGRKSGTGNAATDVALRRALLAWYDTHGRSLPWRRSRDPYRIWLAEVMLQQTRIAVVIPAYRRFLRAFPTLARLADADEEQVLSLWSGLGYYSRARALHRAARTLRTHKARRFPRSLQAARQLPSVGPYVAAAVLSIAYGLPLAAVDGNVIRVLSRLRCLAPAGGGGEPHRSVAQQLLDRVRPGDWNQALMELGETVCLPGTPRCGQCPVIQHCEAFRRGRVHEYPAPRTRRPVERVHLRLTILRDRSGRVLLERGAFPHLTHMWLPPIRILSGDGSRRSSLGKRARQRDHFHHAILHRDFHVDVCSKIIASAELQRRVARSDGVERRLFAEADLEHIGRSSLLTKALKLAQ